MNYVTTIVKPDLGNNHVCTLSWGAIATLTKAHKIKSQDQFQKKIQLKFKQSGKMLPNHNSVLAEHISNLGPEKKLGQDTR